MRRNGCRARAFVQNRGQSLFQIPPVSGEKGSDPRSALTASKHRRNRCRRVQQLAAELAARDLAQRDDGGLVLVRLDQRRGAERDLARAVGRGEGELEAVGKVLHAVVYGDACHGNPSGYLNSSSREARRTACCARDTRVACTTEIRSDNAASKRSLTIIYSNSRTCEISSRALAMRLAIASGASFPLDSKRLRSSASDGGRMKTPTMLGNMLRSCAAPCRSISSRTSWSPAGWLSIQRLLVPW